MQARLAIIAVLVVVVVTGCPGRKDVQCSVDSHCDLGGGGRCTPASGDLWCAYPDPECPSGYRYSDLDVGGGVGGTCVPDGTGIDAGTDAPDASLNCPQTPPVVSGQPADLVLGQPDFVSSAANNPFRSGSSLSTTVGLLAEGTRLWVSDSGNARVLQWNSLPAVNGQSANIAIGQADLINSTSGTSQNQFATGGGYVAKAGTKLAISDSINNRVLIWNTIPTTNGQQADLVLGQTSFTTKVSGSTASSLYGPRGVWTDGTRLVVADRFNNRVLIWNTFPTQNGAAADVVLGASDFGMSPTIVPPTASSFRNPFGVTFSGNRLYVADETNNRVLVWNGIPTTNNAPADQVLGQSGFDSDLKNAGAPFPQVNAIGMSGPNAVLVDDCGSLYVCDTFNGRVMIYTDVPTGNAPAADAVLGKADFMVQPSASVPASDAWMRSCSGLAASGSSLYVGDSGFNRVLRFSLAR